MNVFYFLFACISIFYIGLTFLKHKEKQGSDLFLVVLEAILMIPVVGVFYIPIYLGILIDNGMLKKIKN